MNKQIEDDVKVMDASLVGEIKENVPDHMIRKHVIQRKTGRGIEPIEIVTVRGNVESDRSHRLRAKDEVKIEVYNPDQIDPS